MISTVLPARNKQIQAAQRALVCICAYCAVLKIN